MKSKTKNPLVGLLVLILCLSLLSYSKDTDTSLPDDNLLENLGYMTSEKGMELTYTTTLGDGLGLSQQVRVTDVKDEDGYRVVYSEISALGIVIHSSGRFNKKETISDGADMPAIYYETLENIKQAYNTSFILKKSGNKLILNKLLLQK